MSSAVQPDPRLVSAAAPATPREAITLDTQSLRALAHPVRVRLMTLLREHGPSTATRVAEHLGLNSGATSYHLRQLAAAGLVEEDTELGNARERWWRSAHRGTNFDPYELPATERAASAVYMSAIAAEYGERIRQAAHDSLVYPPDWQRSGDLSDFRLLLSAEESEALINELHAVVWRYRGSHAAVDDVPAGAQVVVTQIQVMPQLSPDVRSGSTVSSPLPVPIQESEPS